MMMTNTQSKTANIIGNKTARACDSCLHKRARWFCAADDAFLCQSCDSSVHSANLLASRHERVRLETALWKTHKHINKLRDHHEIASSSSLTKTWHQGFTKKPRTPRSRKQQKDDGKDDEKKVCEQKLPPAALVPEISYDDENDEGELLLYRVPVLDDITLLKEDEFVDFNLFSKDQDLAGIEIPEFISTDVVGMDLEELDSLLGTEIGEDSCGIQGLCGIRETLEDDCFENTMLKIEEENQEVDLATDCRFDLGLDTESESFNWDFDYSKSPIAEEDEDLKISSDFGNFEMKEKEKRKLNLKINYEEVMATWDCKGSPWTNGIKPDFSPDDCWFDFMETGNGIDEINGINGENVGRSGHGVCFDKEREARVLRYREKRRKRLFAKKIRYEVRKLNAEKRPRLKGRFVKRTSTIASSLPSCYMMNNKQ